MRVVVTGGSGMVGSHLVDRLIERGDSVIVIDSYITGSPKNLAHLDGHPNLAVIVADVAKPIDHPALNGPIDRIYHLASPASPVAYAANPIETLQTNSTGTQLMLELAQRTGARFLYASTSEVYGDPAISPQVESYWGNVNPNGLRSCYDEAKRYGEAITMAYVRTRGVDGRIVRIFNTYGPRSATDDGRVIPNFCAQALRGEPITIYGDGTQTRSFCFVTDTVRGIHLLMEGEGLTGEFVNIGNPREMTITEIAHEIVDLAGSASGITYRPLPADDPTRRKPDIAKAKRLLGWQPEVELRTGLGKTLDYFRGTLT